MRRTFCAFVLLLVAALPAQAQFAVIDPANLAQAVLIAERTQQHYEELRRQFETIRRMAQGLGDMSEFRTPPLALARHDPTRWPYGASWLTALNSGDPTGAAYNQTVIPLGTITDVPARLSPEARAMFERLYSTIEIADSAAQTGGDQIGLVRRYYNRVQRSLDALASDLVDSRPEYHEMTAVLDKIAAGELIARRQDTAINQLLSNALEQLLVRAKSIRDTEAAVVNMQIGTWRDAGQANDALVVGTGDALRTWRQP
jgi:hypothetical protein